MPQSESPNDASGQAPEGLREALAGRYDLRGEVGAGAMGTVYLADDRRHHRRVAIKVPAHRVRGDTGAERFRREISIAAQLSHPHIVPLHDSGVAGGLPYYVMPFVEGETLRERLERDAPLPVEEVLAVARDVAEALDYAHSRGVVHRDVKPGNILLAGGHALVSDFGVARALELALVQDVTATDGSSVGTLAYMSPEQALGGRAVDGRADVYSLGCVIFEMLEGTRPFDAPSAAGVLARHLGGRIPPVTLRDGITPVLRAALESALAKDPEERPETAGALVRSMEAGRLAPAAPANAAGAERRRTLAAAGVAVAVVGGLLWFVTGDPGRVVPLEGRPTSVVVLPFHVTSSEDERETAVNVAAQVTSELNHWDSIYAVPRVALGGPMFDLGLMGPTVGTVADGLRIAGALEVRAMLALSATARGDSVDVEAHLYDAATGRPVDRPLGAGGVRGSPEIARRIAYGVLGLDDSDPGTALHRRSSSPRALSLLAEGERSLGSWRLPEARAAFNAALEADSSFALAYHRLAQTLYWQSADGGRALREAGPEIGRLSSEAVVHGAGLPARDSLHVRAFDAFRLGRYDEARSFYREILDGQPTDVYALLMLGSTEFQDPWLRPTPEGPVPRADLNVAVRAFGEAVRLQPTFELGYGHVFDIHVELANAAYLGSCPGFEEPRQEALAPWDLTPPDRQTAFCPVMLDSIVWVPVAEFRRGDADAARRGADGLFRDALRTLERWAEFAPDQPRPLEVEADVLSRRRLTLVRGPPDEAALLADSARAALAVALALRGDTVAADLYRLANLHLAAGDDEEARRLLDLADARAGDGEVHTVAANVWLATGGIGRALEIVARLEGQRVLEGPGGRLIPYGSSERIIDRVNVLTGLTAGGPLLLEALEELEEAWSRPSYTEDDRAALRADATLRMIAALAADSVARAAWAPRVALDDPLWRGLASSRLAPAEARELVEEARSRRNPNMPEAARSFAAGQVALRAGDARAAVRYFSRLDSLPQPVDFYRPWWSLQVLSTYWRARALEAAGDGAEAVRHYDAFTRAWRRADELASTVLDDARDRRARLARDGGDG